MLLILFAVRLILVITEIELLGYPKLTEEQKTNIKLFLKKCKIIELNDEIKYMTVYLRKNFKIKLPDAIILASALTEKIEFLSNDAKLKKIYNQLK